MKVHSNAGWNRCARARDTCATSCKGARRETGFEVASNLETGKTTELTESTARLSRNHTTDEIFSHGSNTDETRILTGGKTVSWDNSIEKEKRIWGTLIYDN